MKFKLNLLFALCAVFFLTYQNCGKPQWEVTPIEESEKLASTAVNGGNGLVCGLLVQDSQGGMRTNFAATEMASIEVSTLPPGSKVHVTAVDLDTNAMLEDFGTITTPQRLQFSFSQHQVGAGRSVVIQGSISQSAEVTTSCSQILKAFSPSTSGIGGNRTPTTTTMPYFPNTTTTTIPSAQVPTSVELEPGHRLYTGQMIQLQKARMLLQKDGNLVIYDSAGVPIWHSLTSGTADYCTPNCFAVFQTDGNFVTYKEAANGEVTFYWTTQTGTNIPSKMIFQQNEPYLKIVNKNTGEIIWSSSQTTTPPPDSPPPTTTTTTTVPSNPAPQPVKHLVVCRKTTVVGNYSFGDRGLCSGAVDLVICPVKAGYNRVATPVCIQPIRLPKDLFPPPAKPQGLCAYEKSTCTTVMECESGFAMEDRGTCQ